MYSRRLKVEEKENRRKAIGFGFLTLAFVAFMIYFGFPLLGQLSNFGYDLKKSGEPVESSDKTPPAPPRFSDIPKFTNKDNLEVAGTAEPGVTVNIYINSQRQQVIADNTGRFSTHLDLNEDQNDLYAQAEDQSHNQSRETETFTIIFDKKEPDLTVSSPQDGQQFSGQRQKQVTISGQSEKDVTVSVNGRHVVVSSSGVFSYVYGLDDGENTLTVKAQDQAGNTKEVILKVTYAP